MLDWQLYALVGIMVFLAAYLFLVDGSRNRRSKDSRAAGPGARYLYVKGRRRSYHLYVPARLSGKKGIPLVLAFHGGGGHGLRFRAATGFDQVADRFGFVVAYPNAVRYWNDGRPGTRGSPNDVQFVRKLIKHLVKETGVDAKRIYATGQSNGGLLALRLACELSDRIAAFAPVLSSLPVAYRPRCRPKRPLSILFINGTADRLIRWDGGEIPAGTSFGKGGKVVSVPDTIHFFRTHNGCEETPSRQVARERDRNGLSAELLRFKNCRAGGDLALLKIRGGGHVWPGTRLPPQGRRAELTGENSIDLDASLIIWKFFEGRTLH